MTGPRWLASRVFKTLAQAVYAQGNKKGMGVQLAKKPTGSSSFDAEGSQCRVPFGEDGASSAKQQDSGLVVVNLPPASAQGSTQGGMLLCFGRQALGVAIRVLRHIANVNDVHRALGLFVGRDATGGHASQACNVGSSHALDVEQVGAQLGAGSVV
jgi:hypothetical protein